MMSDGSSGEGGEGAFKEVIDNLKEKVKEVEKRDVQKELFKEILRVRDEDRESQQGKEFEGRGRRHGS